MEPETHCYNCQQILTTDSRFCRQCGQKLEPLRPRFGELVGDVFRNTYSFDSRIWRTLRMILHPGRLTQAYFEGKREQFIHPVRLFLFAVIIHLAVINFFITPTTFGPEQLDNTRGSTLVSIQQSIQFAQTFRESIQKDSSTNPSLLIATDSLIQSFRFQFDSLNAEGKLSLGIPWLFAKPVVLTPYEREVITADSICRKNDVTSFSGKLFINQVLKLYRSPNHFGSYLAGRLSWLIFLLMPSLAFILYLLYIRRKCYFVEHLIFTVHYHVFAFLLVSLGIGFNYLTKIQITPVFFLGVLVYIYLAMYNFYKQGPFKTFIKYVLMLIAYFWVALFSSALLLITGFILFS